MIYYDEKARRLISSLGWVDGPCIWVFDVDGRRSRLVHVSSSRFVALRRYADVLRIVHHGGIAPTVSLRRVSSIDREAALLEYDDRPYFSGDDELWSLVDPCVLVPRKSTTVLLYVDAPNKRVRELDLRWFYLGDYDLGYQRPIDCLTLPDREHVVVSIQRSSRLAVVNILENRKVGEIQLAGRSGNPELVLREDGNLIASDYDTLCRVDLEKMAITAAVRLQDESSGGTRQFIGDFIVQSEGIVVARPFSGDVLLVDESDFSVKASASTGAEPLQAVLVAGADVLGRDWKTGHVLEATLALPWKR
jgi:hypothetical protein